MAIRGTVAFDEAITRAIRAGEKASNIYRITNEDVLRHKHLRVFFMAALRDLNKSHSAMITTSLIKAKAAQS